MNSPLNLNTLERFRTEDSDSCCCDWPGCSGEGEHRAPKSRNEIKTYHWFCLDHVRQYNKGWNYYTGMTDDEVEAIVRHVLDFSALGGSTFGDVLADLEPERRPAAGKPGILAGAHAARWSSR